MWALVGVLRGQWLLAGLLAAAGLVRRTAARGRSRSGWRRSSPSSSGATACVRGSAGCCGVGLLGYVGYVGWRTGTPTGWFDIQRTWWNSRFDGGASLARFVGQAVLTGHEATTWRCCWR